jgi:hypothetical protein
MAKEQAAHRQHLERIVVEGNDRRAARGLYIAWFLATLTMVAGVLLIWNGRGVPGLALVLVEAAALAGCSCTARSSSAADASLAHGFTQQLTYSMSLR